MSGITLLAANPNIQHKIEFAFIHYRKYFINTYWIVTVGTPKESSNKSCVGIKSISNPQFKNKRVNLLNLLNFLNFLKINYIYLTKFSANSYHIMV